MENNLHICIKGESAHLKMQFLIARDVWDDILSLKNS